VCVVGSARAVDRGARTERARPVVGGDEEGPYLDIRRFTQREESMVPLLYSQLGLRR